MKFHLKALFLGMSLFSLMLSSCGGDSPEDKKPGGDEDPTEEKFYTVTWQNYNGIVIETDEHVKAGTMPS